MTNMDDLATGLNGKTTVRGTATLLPDPEPSELWCPIISVDDHLLEPPTLFDERLPARLRDSAPKVVHDLEGVPFWQIDGERHPIVLQNGAAGRPIVEWTNAPARFDEFRPGVTEPSARIADMDLAGVWASLAFPSLIWGFAGSRFLKMRDREIGLCCLRAYNDWVIGEWASYAPDRFIATQLPWLADPEIAADEVRKNARRGCSNISFSENPEPLGLPSIYTDHWDPLFQACEETGTVINLHVGGSGIIQRPSTQSAVEVPTALFPLNSMAAIVDWIYARIPIRFPGLRIVLSEGGISWVPTIRERLQRAYGRRECSPGWQPNDPNPVELLERNFWFASIEDPSAFQLLGLIDEDHVMIEMDYPHPDSTWPGVQQLIRSELDHLSPTTIRKICFANAAALYRHPEPPIELVARSVVGQLENMADRR